MKVSEGFKNIQSEDAPGFVDMDVNEIPEYLFREILNRDPEDEFDTRSQVLAFRLPNGDLILGFYPQGDTYEEVTQWYGV